MIRHLMEDQVGRRVVVIVPHVVGSTDGDPTAVHASHARMEWTGGGMMLPSRDPVDDLLQLARLEKRPDHVIVEAHGDESPARLVGYAYMPGFRPNGVYRNVGFKQGAWRDVGWWGRALGTPESDPPPPRPFRA